ncbi:RPII140-upstream gene protein [Chrysoperla carnea]|uniref:RPII140-upstream gene protein n=1 Tax=Chrysoperla carnea TaxID=189513 RepID=UPI001D097E34|nr:RPII140-upstream gene protein [Chrysoperla carnea]
MLRKIFGNSAIVISGVLPFNWEWENFDQIKTTTKASQAFYNRNAENETGWDRLYLMFSLDEFNNFSPELNSTMQAGFMGLFIGACYGGFIRSRVAYLDFMERNQATAFKSHLDAKKQLQDAVTMSFAKGAFQWGWRLGLFTFTYVGFTTAFSVYRGKSGIIEYVGAGALSGTLYKFNGGPRAMLVGGVLGSVLGGTAGILSYGITKLTGMSLEEARYWQYQWKNDREQRVQEIYRRHAEATEDDKLIKHHKQVVGETNPEEVLKNIDSDAKTR